MAETNGASQTSQEENDFEQAEISTIRNPQDYATSNQDAAAEPAPRPGNGFFNTDEDEYTAANETPEQDVVQATLQNEQPPSIETHEPPTNEPTHVAEQSSDEHAPTQDTSSSRNSLHETRETLPPGTFVFVEKALQEIATSKESRRKKGLQEQAQSALASLKSGKYSEPMVIFGPLRSATETGSIPLTATALDCIGKLITYSFFTADNPELRDLPPGSHAVPLIEQAIDTICDCFQDEATPEPVQLQIVKSLLAAILNDKIVVHGAGLLKAVRQVYNIFLYSKSTTNQQIAQGTLTQMIGVVFDRVETRLQKKELRLNVSRAGADKDDSTANTPVPNGESENVDPMDEASETSSVTVGGASRIESGEKLTLQSFENTKNFDDTSIADNSPTKITRARHQTRASRSSSVQISSGSEHVDYIDEDEEDELHVKDAFLVFRSMCRLSTKILPPEQLQDLRSHNMRSKLVSLSIIRLLLNNYPDLFSSPFVTIRSSSGNDPTSFGQAVNQYLRLSLSRNGASSVRQVFEMSCEIFWLMLKNMRVMLKREIEVFLKEIYLAILERRNAPNFQKLYIMKIFQRLSEDPRALVEIYLNYDCDRGALDNIYQRIIEHLSRLSSLTTALPAQQMANLEQLARSEDDHDWQAQGRMPPSLTTVALGSAQTAESEIPLEITMKQGSLECLVLTLRSLLAWAQESLPAARPDRPSLAVPRLSIDEIRGSIDHTRGTNSPLGNGLETPIAPSTPLLNDDPGEFEKAKQRKTALTAGIRLFNFKPKRGLAMLINDGFIPSDKPEDVAKFLVENDQLDKTTLGEYLGEADQYNVAIMHAFVDSMDFNQRRFVDSLRQFLQSFRLPGEAQKIDRFVLKFAERYLTGNPNAFANADTAYVLSYSVIMLNVDQHSTKMKGRRMSKEEFIKNNRGINDNADLPDEYLIEIYDEIAQNEIVLKTEREHAAAIGLTPAAPTGGLFARDNLRGAAQQADQEMSSKAEQRLRGLMRSQRKAATEAGGVRYIPATSKKHIGPMFDVTWMSFLTGLSSQMQTTHNFETVKLCVEGLKLAVRISCIFDLETARIAFVTALSNCTNLANPREMVRRNLEALKALLEIASLEGDTLGSSWTEILTCISQLDRFQLLSGGVDEEVVPDMRKGSMKSTNDPRRNGSVAKKRQGAGSIAGFNADIVEEIRSAEMTKTVDKIFTSTAELSGEGMKHFARSLSEVSWSEIQSAGNSDSPRMYSLQKLVEISYYNMTRVRFEWSSIWLVLGDHFNQVGTHPNAHIVRFALDSLRQLSMRFMEFEELPHFQFQKDFLKPFEHIMANSHVVPIKELILWCIIQMIQARGDNIRSGWKTMLGVFTVAAREPHETLVNLAYEHVSNIYNNRFGVVITQGAFPDLIVCLTEFAKNHKFQKRALQAIEVLKATVPKMLKTPECPLSLRKPRSSKEHGKPEPMSVEDQQMQDLFWFPVLFAFHDILMTGEDLETRSQALNYLFDVIIRYGKDFPPGFWDVLWQQFLYPIFTVLRSKSEMSKVQNHEDLSVWLSTTMIQALRNMMALFTHYFDQIEYMLDRFLGLLALAICQESDTISRIGSNCLQTLILQNVSKFDLGHWHQIVSAFVDLFERTTAKELFTATKNLSGISAGEGLGLTSDSTSDLTMVETPPLVPAKDDLQEPNGQSRGASGEKPAMRIDIDKVREGYKEPKLEDFRPHNGVPHQQVVVTTARRRFFNKIITRCVLQLLMIETVNELFSNNDVYAQIPSPELLRLMALLKKSYHFAKRFNNDKELRMKLWEEGFMKQPPNLLKQESNSAATYVAILVRMYFDEGEERRHNRAETEAALIPLCADIIGSYNQLDNETQHRNIIAWRPVVVDILEGYTNFPREDFEKHIETFYPLAVFLLNRDLTPELRGALLGLLHRVGEVRMGMEPPLSALPTPSSPYSSRSAYFSRRNSKMDSAK